MPRYKRSPREFGLPPRAAGGGEDYVAGIPRNLLNDFNREVTVVIPKDPVNVSSAPLLLVYKNRFCTKSPRPNIVSATNGNDAILSPCREYIAPAP